MDYGIQTGTSTTARNVGRFSIPQDQNKRFNLFGLENNNNKTANTSQNKFNIALTQKKNYSYTEIKKKQTATIQSQKMMREQVNN